MTMIIGSRRTSLRWSGIQESDAAGELPVRAAPSRDPGLDPEKLEIPACKIRTDLAEMTALDRGIRPTNTMLKASARPVTLRVIAVRRRVEG
jgi:hypothetical protein